MKVIVLESEAWSLARILHALVRGDSVVTPLTTWQAALLEGLAEKLDAPGDYVAVHKENDLPLIMDLLDFERDTAEEQLRDHQHNNPEFVPESQARLEYAIEVYDRLREQLP